MAGPFTECLGLNDFFCLLAPQGHRAWSPDRSRVSEPGVWAHTGRARRDIGSTGVRFSGACGKIRGGMRADPPPGEKSWIVW